MRSEAKAFSMRIGCSVRASPNHRESCSNSSTWRKRRAMQRQSKQCESFKGVWKGWGCSAGIRHQMESLFPDDRSLAASCAYIVSFLAIDR